ncbi:hypothetical protein DQW09_09710 [Ensifer adhaerens]|nr:hypothetical protein DQW09_09710 [Ensifer adhaerens]
MFLATASGVFAYCSEPSTTISLPDAPGSFSKPDVPHCLSDFRYSGGHTCSDWEISSYQDEVDSYIRKLNNYVSEAADAAKEAADFASEAEQYARCEAEEVATQHK